MTIDDHAEECIARVQALCRQPSITVQHAGMEEATQMVAGMLRES